MQPLAELPFSIALDHMLLPTYGSSYYGVRGTGTPVAVAAGRMRAVHPICKISKCLDYRFTSGQLFARLPQPSTCVNRIQLSNINCQAYFADRSSNLLPQTPSTSTSIIDNSDINTISSKI